jgi:hypothetical protein
MGKKKMDTGFKKGLAVELDWVPHQGGFSRC